MRKGKREGGAVGHYQTWWSHVYTLQIPNVCHKFYTLILNTCYCKGMFH